MRKLLLLVALLPAMTMMGERTAREAIQEAAANAVERVDAQVRNVEMTQPGDPVISLSPDVKATVRLNPFYKRPAGSFYVCQQSGTKDLLMPYIAVAPAATTNFDDATDYVPSGTTRQWRVQLTDWYSVQGNEMPPLKWFTVNDNDRYGLAVQYENNEVDSVPELDLTYQGRTFDYKMQSVIVDDIVTPSNIEYDWIQLLATPNLSDVLETAQLLHSSKYFAHYARIKDYDWDGMFIPKHSTKGFWFGTNTTAWNASAVAFEKPDRPYALRSIVLKYTFLRLNRPTTMRARVYRMSSIPSFINGESVYVDPSTLELVAEGFADVDFETGTSGTASDGNAYSMGSITFPLVERDGILYYEVKPEIDFPILVVVDGYHTDDFETFTLYLSNDNIDEGYGELGYICQLDDDGNPAVIKGINYCFGGKEQYTAPSIFLDVEHPFLAFNDVYETGGRGVTENGASFDIVYYSSQPASSGWDFTEYKTESLPKWIHVTARDSTKNGEYLDKSVVTYYVEKMPSSVRGRRCVVDVHYPGVHSYFLIVQGTMPGGNLQMGDLNGDGVTNVQDVTIMIRRILGDTIYGNYYEALADLTGEGEVDVKDITALIKVILGSNVSTAPDVRIIPITKSEADELSDPIREHILVKAN